MSCATESGKALSGYGMESFFSTLKRERVHRRRYWTRDEATDDLGDYIDGFYNLTRRHSELGGVSPVQYETMVKLTYYREHFIGDIIRPRSKHETRRNRL